MSETPNPSPRTRTPLGVRVALFVSLALNLAVIGVVAGFVWRGGPDGVPSRHVRDVVAPYTAALDREARREIGRRIFRNPREDEPRKDLRAQVRMEYAEALELLRQDPFDPQAFSELLTRQNGRAAERQKRGQAELVAHVASMSADERRAYADRVSEALKRFGRGKR